MSNRRFIVFFLFGSIFLAAALLILEWRTRIVATSATRNTLCMLRAEDVDALELAFGGTTNIVRLARGEKGAWRLESPYSAPADPAAVLRLIDVATALPLGDMRTAAELAELHEDFLDFGLAGNARATLRLRAGAASARVFFGATTASGQEVYARTEGVRNVFTLPVTALEALPADADGFRLRTLVACPSEEVAGIDLRGRDHAFLKLVRTAGGWGISAPVAAPADAVAVETLVAGLARARIAGFVLPSAEHPAASADGDVIPPSELVQYGLSADAGHAVTIRSQTGVAERIVFGDPVGTNSVYALVGNGTAVVLLERAVVDLCRSGDESFRDTRVFPLGKDERLLSVSFSEGELVYVLSQTNDLWRLVAPVAAAADPAVAAAVVDRVLHLRRRDVGETAEGGMVRVSVTTSAGTLPGVMVPRAVFAESGSFVNLRTKTLLELDATAVRRITLKGREVASSVVVRDAERGAWNVDAAAGGVPATVSQDAVRALLTALTRVEALGVETLAATPADFRRCALEEPFFTLAIDFDGADAVRKNILLGGVAPGGGRYATVGGADAVFVLSRTTVAGLTAPITEESRK